MQSRAERAERREVGDVAGGEKQRRILAVEVRQLGLQEHVLVRRPGDVARAVGAGPIAVDRLVHGREHLGMLTHAEMVVRAPDGDVRSEAFAVAPRSRKVAAAALQFGKTR